MKKMTLAALAFAAAPLAQAAPLVDVYVGGYAWHPETSGTIASGGNDIDVHNDLGYQKSNQNVIFVGVEQPVPLIPNVRLRYVDLSDNASNTIVQPITFNGKTFTGQVASSYDVKMLDGTFYWSPLNNWLKLDLGVTVRQVDAKFKIRGAGQQAHENANITFPMGHLAAEADLPFTGTYVGGEVDGVRYSGNSIVDYNAHLGWRSDYLLGIELGYRRLNLKLNDVSNLDTNLKVGGPYLALTLNF